MPFIENIEFQKIAVLPDNARDNKIWRYMDFTKLISLLDTKALWFTRADKMTKLDKNEGLYFPEFTNKLLENPVVKENKPTMDNLSAHFKNQNEYNKQFLVNCWHMNEVESSNMWKAYAGRGYGVAVQSTFRKLAGSFHVAEDTVWIGPVSYSENTLMNALTRCRYKIEAMNSYIPLMVKRKYYEDEKEVRAVIWNRKPLGDEGKYIQVDLNVLLDKIILAPQTEKWVLNLVKSVAKAYKIEVDVEPSILDQGPLYI